MNWRLPTLAILAFATLGLARAATVPGTPPAQDGDPAPTAARAVRLVPAPEGNEVRFRVREQLANFDFPNDAVGKTAAITGGVTINDDGTIARESSKFVIDLTTLESDQSMRDRFIKRRTLATEEYPNVTFVPVSVRGLSLPLPTSGEMNLEVTGDLTVRDQTRSTTWAMTVRAAPGQWSGSATTAITFEQFGLTKPRVARVLSVQDTIRLEYDFRLVVEPPADAEGK